jgi:hypothetical protein
MRWPAVALSACLLAALPGVGAAQTYSTAVRAPVVAYPAPYVAGCFIPMPPWAMRSSRTAVPRPGSTPVPAPVFAPTFPDAGAVALPSPALAVAATPPDSEGGSYTGPPAPTTPPMLGGLLGDGRAAERNPSGAAVRTIPLATRGTFEVSENESPRPVDRVFATFDSVGGARDADNRPDAYCGTVGFEKTFLDGNASFGLRAPLVQASGTGIDGFGDLSLVSKYAFLHDAETGTVASGGLVVTAPTGRSVTLADGSKSNSLLLQPWVGGILALGDAYALGFSSIVASSQNRDPTLYNLDLGLGYRLYQSQNPRAVLSSIIPTLEGHLTTAFGNHPSSNIQYADAFVVTGGVHLGLFQHAYLTVGGAFPVAGGRGKEFGAIARFNYQF